MSIYTQKIQQDRRGKGRAVTMHHDNKKSVGTEFPNGTTGAGLRSRCEWPANDRPERVPSQ